MQTPSQQDSKEQAIPRRPITQEALGLWRNHPTSQVVLQYLRDLRSQMASNIADTVFVGAGIEQSFLEETAHKCGLIGEIVDLEAHDINEFYQVKTQQEERETENGSELQRTSTDY